MKKLLWISAVILLAACTKEKETVSDHLITDTTTIIADTAAVVPDSASVAPTKGLEKFGFPPEVVGCSCYFAENKADFQNEKYVYVDDYGNSAYIKLNGKLIKITMQEGDFDPSNFDRTIQNESYKIHMTGKKISELEETMMFDGTMTVEDLKTGEKFATPIYGECGC